jgi:CheY-like chemotaxis protein
MQTEKAVRQKRCVLVVDDNTVLTATLKHLLESHGYEARIFPDGADALKHVLHQNVDAVICDMEMPQLEGNTLYTTIERIEPRLADRFIFVTGRVSSPQYQAFFDHVGCPVLEKPVDTEDLLQSLKDVLAR